MVQRCIGDCGTRDGAFPGNFPFAGSSEPGFFAFWASDPSMFSQDSRFGEAIGLAEPWLIEDHLRCCVLPNLGRSGSQASSLCFGDHSCQPSPLDTISDLTAMFFFLV